MTPDPQKVIEAFTDKTTRKLFTAFSICPGSIAETIRMTEVPQTSGFRAANWLKKNKLIVPDTERVVTTAAGSVTVYKSTVKSISIKINGVNTGLWG